MTKAKTSNLVKSGLGLLFIVLLCPKTALAAPVSQITCKDALISSTLSTLLKQNIYGDRNERQTLNYIGHNNEDQVVLLKADKKSGWESNYSPYPGSPHGDPRLFYYFAGTELAQNFGFELRETEDKVFLLAPSAKLLKKIIENLNKGLIATGKEPITGLPVKAGYLNAQDMMDLSVDTAEHFELYFPYEDNNAELTPHEVSYHLFMLLYSKKILKKAREINLQTMKVIDDLRKGLLPKVEIIAKALFDARTADMDVGTALIGYWLAKNRAQYASSYKDLLNKVNIPFAPIKRPLISFVDPTHSAQESVLISLKHILDTTVLLNSIEKQAYFKWRDQRMKSKDYINSIPQVRDDPETWTKEFIGTLDARIEELNTVFRSFKN